MMLGTAQRLQQNPGRIIALCEAPILAIHNDKRQTYFGDVPGSSDMNAYILPTLHIS